EFVQLVLQVVQLGVLRRHVADLRGRTRIVVGGHGRCGALLGTRARVPSVGLARFVRCWFVCPGLVSGVLVARTVVFARPLELRPLEVGAAEAGALLSRTFVVSAVPVVSGFGAVEVGVSRLPEPGVALVPFGTVGVPVGTEAVVTEAARGGHARDSRGTGHTRGAGHSGDAVQPARLTMLGALGALLLARLVELLPRVGCGAFLLLLGRRHDRVGHRGRRAGVEVGTGLARFGLLGLGPAERCPFPAGFAGVLGFGRVRPTGGLAGTEVGHLRVRGALFEGRVRFESLGLFEPLRLFERRGGLVVEVVESWVSLRAGLLGVSGLVGRVAGAVGAGTLLPACVVVILVPRVTNVPAVVRSGLTGRRDGVERGPFGARRTLAVTTELLVQRLGGLAGPAYGQFGFVGLLGRGRAVPRGHGTRGTHRAGPGQSGRTERRGARGRGLAGLGRLGHAGCSRVTGLAGTCCLGSACLAGGSTGGGSCGRCLLGALVVRGGLGRLGG